MTGRDDDARPAFNAENVLAAAFAIAGIGDPGGSPIRVHPPLGKEQLDARRRSGLAALATVIEEHAAQLAALRALRRMAQRGTFPATEREREPWFPGLDVLAERSTATGTEPVDVAERDLAMVCGTRVLASGGEWTEGDEPPFAVYVEWIAEGVRQYGLADGSAPVPPLARTNVEAPL
jgi:hypothetical protein